MSSKRVVTFVGLGIEELIASASVGDSEGMVFDNSPRCGGGLLHRANPPRASRWRDLPRRSLANHDRMGVMLRIHELSNLESPRIEPRSQQGLQHSRPHRVTTPAVRRRDAAAIN